MEENRKAVIVLGIGGLFVLAFLVTVTHHPPIFYWGIPIGTIFGIATCVYLSVAWDPRRLEPTNPETRKASWNLLWVVPLGILAANLSSYFLSEAIEQLLLGCIFTWIFITSGYFVIQVWRYR